jgi:hypothetical protein
MGQQTELKGSPTWVEIAPGGYALRAPALRGKVTEMEAADNATRSDGGTHEGPLLDALARADISAVKVFEIEPIAIDTDAGGTSRAAADIETPDGEPAVLLRVPPLGPKVEHAVLYTDEAGVSRWIYPLVHTAPTDATDGPEFLLPRDPAPLPPTKERASRGELTKLGRRMVRVLAWATEDIIGKGALALASAWEQRRRPYAMRGFPLDGTLPVDWEALRGGRALLLVHGTFSTAADAFALMPACTWDALGQLYGGRIFAFDHPSLHHSPADNVREMHSMLPPGIDLEVDVITHSRGGLVARELLQQPPMGSARLRVRRAIFVAAPHRGTVLTDSEHGIEMLDRYTNLFTELPDNAFTIGVEALFMLAKLAYHGAMRGLPGLTAMLPQGPYLQRLDGGAVHAALFHAISSDFKPRGSTLLSRFGWKAADAAIDGIFGEGNDGVVPTAGGYELRRTGSGFPIADGERLVFGHPDGIHHLNFFGHARTGAKLVEWLSR